MSDRFFGSAAEASSGLGIPLLIAASPSAAVPRHGVRLSEFAPDLFEGGRLFHRLPIERDDTNAAIWVTGPNGTTEYVVWAVGLAEHAARAGFAAYLIDLDPAHPLSPLAPGEGQALPAPILDRICRLGAAGALAWATDLQGVRLVIPTLEPAGGNPGPEPARSILVFARALPEEGEGISIPPDAIAGVCLAAAIRDHTREELGEAIAGLHRSGHTVLGLVAMGPTPVSKRSPLDRWERVAAPAGPAVQETASVVSPVQPVQSREPLPVTGSLPAPTPAPAEKPVMPLSPEPGKVKSSVAGSAPSEKPAAVVSTAPAAGTPPATAPSRPPEGPPSKDQQHEILTPVEPSVSLVADWHRGERKRPRAWLLAALGIVLALAALAIWLRSTGRTPAEAFSSLRGSIGKATGSRGSAPAQVVGGTREPPGGRGAFPSDAATIEQGGGGVPAAADSGAGMRIDAGGSGLVPILGSSSPDSAPPARSPEVWEQLSPERPRDSSATVSMAPELRAPDSSAVTTAAGRRSLPDTLSNEPVSNSIAVSWDDKFVVHVSSFRIEKDAETEVARLQAAGVPARILTVVLPERGRWHRVLVGPYPDSSSAVEEAGVLRSRGLVSFTQTLRMTESGPERAPAPR